mgnify:CR=1 FL=1
MEMNKTTVDQLHGRFDDVKKKESGKKLFIDLDICNSDKCEECVVECSYFYHPVNNGMFDEHNVAILCPYMQAV